MPGWQTMVETACTLISREQAEDGAFNYWLSTAHERQRDPYPHDLDDTALALATLSLYRPEAVNGEQFAKLVKLLTRSELAVGGPYNTWLVNFMANPAWRDCDIAVNANVAFLLSLHDIFLPNLTEYFERCLGTQELHSIYYLSPLTIIYFWSRAYQGGEVSAAVAYIRQARLPSGHWGSPLLTALAVSALARWESCVEEDRAITYLLQTGEAGFWPAEGIYLERASGSEEWYHGSEALTTAFCLEALHLYSQQTASAPEMLPQPVTPSEKHDQWRTELRTTFITQAAEVSPAFGRLAEVSVQTFEQHPFWRDALLLPVWWQKALGKRGEAITVDMIRRLCVWQLAGLAAYAVFDDLIDGQGSGQEVPFAVWCVRQFSTGYARLLPEWESGEKIVSNLEAALQAEISQRLVKQGTTYALPSDVSCSQALADKSLGYALPALALLVQVEAEEAEQAHAEQYFWCLLAARQYNDDSHDIIEDLQAGRLTPANCLVLKEWQKRNSALAQLNVKQHATNLSEIFWHAVFPEVCQRIEGLLEQALLHLEALELEQPEYFASLITEQAQGLARARQERQQTLEFLQNY